MSLFSSGIAQPEGMFTGFNKKTNPIIDTLENIDPSNPIYLQLIGAAPVNNTTSSYQQNGIMNGAFQIWQRATTITSPTNGKYLADRWKYYTQGTTAVHEVTRSTDIPGENPAVGADAGTEGFVYSMLVDCTTADASLGVSDIVMIRHPMEIDRWEKFVCRENTLSFWIKATKTGTYSVSISGNSPEVSLIKTYTVLNADTWEYKTIYIPKYTGAWSASQHAHLNFVLMSGSTYHGVTGDWTTQSQLYAASGQVNACDSTANNWRITGVQLQPGRVATDFIHTEFTTELFQCMRFYEKSFHYQTLPAFGVSWTLGRPAIGVQVVGASTSQPMAAEVVFRVGKFAAATGSNTLVYNPVTASSTEFRNITAAADCSARALTSASQDGLVFSTTTAAGSAAGQVMALHWATDVDI